MYFWPFRKPRNRQRPPVVPTGTRVYAIGDVHGRLDLLIELIGLLEHDNLARDPGETHVVMLGDLIDRGPDSAGVIDFLLNERPGFATFHFLMGNHEESMLDSLQDSADPRATGWLRYGGMEALRSYGVPDDAFDLHGRLLSDELSRYVPRAHLDFLRSFEDKIQFGDYLFVHAGIRPGRAIPKQTSADMRWIRAPFLADTRNHGPVVVHGHTIEPDVVFAQNRIGIDTGAYVTGVLTALGLEETGQWLLQTGGAR